MTIRYLVLDVFARAPLEGNALAVFPDPGTVPPERMQQVAREMNLSETTFVTGVRPDGYDVRIFTPYNEMGFAGHPTLGTAWALRRLGAVTGASTVQRSAAGATEVTFDGDRVWLSRTGAAGPDIDAEDALRALGASPADASFDAATLGAPAATLRPAIVDSGSRQLIVPVRSPDVLQGLHVPTSLGDVDGAYCVTALGPGRVLARFFAPGLGVPEDPATGSAAANLGIYLADRAGEISVEIEQGTQVGRPSVLSVAASAGVVRVGGAVLLVAEGTLHL